MSSLIFITNENQVLVATDTLGTAPDGSGTPKCFTTKAFILPHLRMIIAGTGVGDFLGKWFIEITSHMVIKGIDNLDQHAPRILPTVWESQRKEYSIPESMTTTVYHFGFSEETGLIHTYVYRSTNNFMSEPLAYCTAVKPDCTPIIPLQGVEDFRKMMDEQRAIQASRPKEERIYIGGEIQLYVLSKEGFLVKAISRFDDYDSVEKAIYENYELNKK